ncbi:Vacuolar protein sorting-associated protein 37B [Mactra antiquata]
MYRDFQRQESDANMNLQAPKYEPDENAAVALLQYLTKEQLEEYLSDNSKIDSLIADLHQTKSFSRDRENIIVKNKSLAEFNISLQPNLDSLKQQTATAYEEVNGLKVSLAKDVAKLDMAPGCQSHDTMLAIFQTEVATVDEKSEEVAEEFCEGKIDLDTFISEYIPKRTDAYKKKAKLEKVGDLLRQGNSHSVNYSTTTSTPYSPPQTHNSQAGYNAAGYPAGGYRGSAPYPSGQQGSFGMPMPSYYQR